MNISNLLKIAYDAILRNKTRTLLTILGVVIGIASVITMVSLGQSSTQSINNQVSQMGTNMIMVMRSQQRRGGWPDSAWEQQCRGTNTGLIALHSRNKEI